MSFAKNVSVVICVKNVEKIIEPCLKSILENNPKEIIVIDGQSHDRTKEIAQLFNAYVFSDEGKDYRMLVALVLSNHKVSTFYF